MARVVVICVAAWVCLLTGWPQAKADTLFVAGGDGIYAFEFDGSSGKLSSPILASKLGAITSLGVHPTGWFLFATCHEGPAGGGGAGQLVSFFVEPNSGSLDKINRVETGGAKAVHAEVDLARSMVLVANYLGGTVAGFPVAEDGKLRERTVWVQHEGNSVVLPAQAQAHPAQVRVSPDHRHIYVADLGIDEILIYTCGEGGLRPGIVPAAKVGEGEGPRRMDFHPARPLVYLASELSSRITVFQRDSKSGALTAIQSTRTVPPDFRGKNECTEIQVHPSGRFLYVSNLGHDSIATYAVDDQGFVTPIQHQPAGGKSPRHFAVHSSGKWLIAGNQESGSLVVFSINLETGELAPCGDPVPVWAPCCLKFAPEP